MLLVTCSSASRASYAASFGRNPVFSFSLTDPEAMSFCSAATANENEGVDIEGFPSLTFYPKGGEKSKNADGRSFSELREWLGKNSEVYQKHFPDEKIDKADDPKSEEGDEPDNLGDEGEGDGSNPEDWEPDDIPEDGDIDWD